MQTMMIAAIITVAVGSSGDESLHQRFAMSTDEVLVELVKANPRLVQEKDDSECTALHYAARYGRTNTAKWLIEQRADVNTIAYNDFTPMHVVKDGVTARVLIQSGADLDARDAWGKTPLQGAAEMGNTDVADAILASGYPIDLASALWLGKREVVMAMLNEKPAIARTVVQNANLWRNTSPLGIATSKGDKEMVELLLKSGAPVNATTDRPGAGPMTALTNAVRSGHYEIAELLCRAGADCNVSGGKFYPRLLDYALKHSDKKMIDLLKRYGARPSGKEV